MPASVPLASARSDARRNSARLVAAAAKVFSEKGTNASLDEIARRAGLGSATLYRHFPTRDSLLTAVFWDRVEDLCSCGEGLAKAPDPDEALITWLRALIELTMQRGLAAALMGECGQETSRLFAMTRQWLKDTAQPLVDRARRDGSFRSDLSADLVVTFAHAIAMCAVVQPDAAGAADRMLSMLVDGLRTR